MKQNKTARHAQGAKTAPEMEDVKHLTKEELAKFTTIEGVLATEEKKRGGNILYTLQQFNKMIKKMRAQNLIDETELAAMKALSETILRKYTKMD